MLLRIHNPQFGRTQDLQPGEEVVFGREVRDVGRGRGAGEAIFIPRSDSAAEDDGWVLVYVHDAGRDACDVVVIDAQDFTAPPVATVHLPVRVPFGFHGGWAPDVNAAPVGA